jgi:hypothetical protein
MKCEAPPWLGYILVSVMREAAGPRSKHTYFYSLQAPEPQKGVERMGLPGHENAAGTPPQTGSGRAARRVARPSRAGASPERRQEVAHRAQQLQRRLHVHGMPAIWQLQQRVARARHGGRRPRRAAPACAVAGGAGASRCELRQHTAVDGDKLWVQRPRHQQQRDAHAGQAAPERLLHERAVTGRDVRGEVRGSSGWQHGLHASVSSRGR